MNFLLTVPRIILGIPAVLPVAAAVDQRLVYLAVKYWAHWVRTRAGQSVSRPVFAVSLD